MEYLPPGKVGASNLPLFARCIGSQDECTFARPHQNSYTAHLSLRREQDNLNPMFWLRPRSSFSAQKTDSKPTGALGGDAPCGTAEFNTSPPTGILPESGMRG